MVFKQVVVWLLILCLFSSCNNNNNKNKSSEIKLKSNIEIKLNSVTFTGDYINISYLKQEAVEGGYCFLEVLDGLQLSNNYINSNYFILKKSEVLKKNSRFPIYYEEILKFYDTCFEVNCYIIKNHKRKNLLLIGKSKGATGIGVDYWNYKCFSLNGISHIKDFTSLSKTPLSVFFNQKLELRFVLVDDNYPRPASGIIDLKYYPIIASLVDEREKVIKEIELDCHTWFVTRKK